MLICETINQATRLHDKPVFKQDQPSCFGFLSSPTYIFRKEWNQLPVQLRCIDDYSIVKTRSNRYFWEAYFNLPQNL